MNRLIVLVSLILSIGNAGSGYKERQPIQVDDVFTGNQLPYWGEICTDAKVYGDPYGLNEALYSVSSGEKVTLRELYGAWVMIAPANWIQLSAVCPW